MRDARRFAIFQILTIALLTTTTNGENLRVASSTKRNLGEALLVENKEINYASIESMKQEQKHDIESKQQSSQSNNDLTVIVHIGPMKTGSSAIQRLFNPLQSALLQDNYEVAGKNFGPGNMHINFFKCFKNETYGSKYDNTYGFSTKYYTGCRDETLDYVAEVAKRGHNLILSAEFMATPERDIDALKEFLKPWKHVHVVAYYRRYYEWLYSFWNQNEKHRAPTKRIPITKDLAKRVATDDDLFDYFYVGSISRWQKKFDNFKIYNLHTIPDGDVRENFFCNALVHSNHTCRQYESDMAKGLYAEKPNPSLPLVYDDLAYHSRDMGLWVEDEGKNLTLETVAYLAHLHQEVELNLTALDFTGLQCPDKTELNWLLQKSLLAEEMMFPETFRTQGEPQIRQEFEKIKHTRYCSIDVAVALEDSLEWQEFFKSL